MWLMWILFIMQLNDVWPVYEVTSLLPIFAQSFLNYEDFNISKDILVPFKQIWCFAFIWSIPNSCCISPDIQFDGNIRNEQNDNMINKVMITRVRYEVISDACTELVNCFSRASIGRINSYPMRIWRTPCLFTIPWPSEPQTTANDQTCFTSGLLTGESTSFRPREFTLWMRKHLTLV